MAPTNTGPDAGILILIIIWWLGFFVALAWSVRQTGESTMPSGFKVFMAAWATAVVAYIVTK